MIKHSKTDKTTAEKIWNQIEAFSDYGFNKVHSACYALIAYQTAYLKANFPDAFMAALMTSDYDNIDRLAIEITECKKMGIQVLAPDINESFHEFGVVPDKNQIRFGMDAIKNVGHGAVEEILRSRIDQATLERHMGMERCAQWKINQPPSPERQSVEATQHITQWPVQLLSQLWLRGCFSDCCKSSYR